MTSQPEPGQMRPDDFGGGILGQARPVAGQQRPPDGGLRGSRAPQPAPGLGGRELHPGEPAGTEPLDRQPRRRRSGRRAFAFACLLSAGLVGLAVAAIGIAHQLLPRQFTPAQQRSISTWEMERRWRSLPVGTIFPASVSYAVPGQALGSGQNLVLQARLLGISSHTTDCAAAVSGAAARVLAQYRCSAALRATYVDASGSMVATVAVAVLPDSAAASAVVSALTGSDAAGEETSSVPLARALRVARTPAASFGDKQRQLSQALGAGPYVILSSAGFSDGRPRVRMASDGYLDDEMVSLTAGLVRSAADVLGAKPPVPVCPKAPGC